MNNGEPIVTASRKGGVLTRVAAGLVGVALLLCGCAKRPPEAGAAADPATSVIAVVVGTTSETLAETTYPDATIRKFDGLSDAVTALQSGKAEFVLTAYTNCVNFARHQPDLTVLPTNLSSEGCAVAVNKSEPALHAAISARIEAYRADGTLKMLEEHWIKPTGGEYVMSDIEEDESAPILNIAISAEREPMSFVQNGEVVGLDIELARLLCRDLGYRPVFHDMKFSAMIPSVLSGKTPIAISNISATEERRESVDFSPEYFFNPQSLLTRAALAGEAAGAETLQSLNGRPIGILTGTVFDRTTTAFLPDSEQRFYNTSADLIIALTQGKIDGFMTDEPVSRLMLTTNEGLAALPDLLQQEDYAFAFPKTEDGARVCGQMNEYLRKLSADGTLDKLIEKWMDGSEGDKRMEDADGIPDGGSGVLCIASSFESEPFSYLKDNLYVGYELELMAGFCKAYGYGLTIDNANFSALIPGLVSGSFDVAASCITITEERAESVRFSDPIYNGGVVMMVRAGAPAASVEAGFFDSLAASFEKNFIREARWKLIAEGIGVTLLISVCSAILGGAIGFGVCMLRRDRRALPSGVAKAFIRVIQGTPVVVLLMILFYVVLNKTGLDGVAVAIIAFGLNFGAYAAEILRSGLDAVDAGQLEAAAAIGFSRGETFRLITLPQAARHFLPVLKGEFISLVKMTSVVGYVAVQDLTKASDIIRSRTYEAFFPLIVTAILYFLLAWGLSSLLTLVEVRTDPKLRKRNLQRKRIAKGGAAE